MSRHKYSYKLEEIGICKWEGIFPRPGLLKEEPSVLSLYQPLEGFSHLTRTSLCGRFRGFLVATEHISMALEKKTSRTLTPVVAK